MVSYILKDLWFKAPLATLPMDSQLPTVISEAITRAMQPYGGVGKIELLALERKVSDAADKFVVFDLSGAPTLVVILASLKDPTSVREGAELAILARSHLGTDLGSCVLVPLEVGESEGVSFSITRYCLPRNRWVRRWEQDKVFEWLGQVAYYTAVDPLPEEIEVKFVQPLQALSKFEDLPLDVRNAAKEALTQLQSNSWHPRLMLAHNDLWSGNFLKALPENEHEWPFSIIDWAGSEIAGHGIYDLVRLAIDINISPSKCAKQLLIHCDALKCQPLQAKYYLLSALGNLAENLGHWQVDRFVGTTISCLEYLDLTVDELNKM